MKTQHNKLGPVVSLFVCVNAAAAAGFVGCGGFLLLLLLLSERWIVVPVYFGFAALPNSTSSGLTFTFNPAWMRNLCEIVVAVAFFSGPLRPVPNVCQRLEDLQSRLQTTTTKKKEKCAHANGCVAPNKPD